MGINLSERFENHRDVSSPENVGDAKKITECYNDDVYDDSFSKKLDDTEKYYDKFLSPDAVKLIDEFDTRTKIDNKVKELPKTDLPKEKQNTFRGANYRTVEANEDLTLYRVYDKNKEGEYLTTELPTDRMTSKIDSALLPEWKNSRKYYCEVDVPKGTIMNIGKVAEQRTRDNTLLKGGADQILVSKEFVSEKEHYKQSYELNFGGNYHEFEKKAKDIER